MTKNKLILEIVFVISLLFNFAILLNFAVDKYDDSKHYNNTKSYGSMNVENWDNMTILNRRYTGLVSDFRYLLLHDLVHYGELDTMLLANNRAHFSYTVLKEIPAGDINKMRSKITYELDSVYYEYMKSINYIYCHTTEDSLAIEKSDTYKVFEHFTNKDYVKR